jgi:hypothetical protein
MLLRNGKIVKIGKADEVTTKYIKENMSDEERRMIKEIQERRELEEKKKKEIKKVEHEEKKNKIAEVVGVEFFDKNNSKKNVFETGGILNIIVDFKINRELDNPIFGIVINDDGGRRVYAINTLHKKIKTGFVEKGEKVFIFSIENYFSTGNYSVSPAIATKNKNNIDWKDKIRYFKVVNKDFSSNAIADFRTNIIIKK